MLKKIVFSSGVVVSLFCAGFVGASEKVNVDIVAGKAKAAICAACHGSAGISSNPMYPNLAGQKAAYTVKQLKAFKSGKRVESSMLGFARMLSDSDIVNIAAYYESLKK